MRRQKRDGGKMSAKRITTILVLISLALFQAGFAAHLALFGGRWFEWVNFVSLPVVLIAIFERRRRNFSWFAAVFGGFFLDIYSSRFFGFWIIALAVLVLIIKLGIKKYVRIPSYW
jgi:hypothetical protein